MPYADRKIRLRHQRKLRDKRRKDGVCTRCSGPRDSVYMDCASCRNKSNRIVMKIIRRNIQNGKCACGKTRLKKKFVCKKCAAVSRKRQQKLKKQVIIGYGGKCACCGEDQIEFLAIDSPFNPPK